MHDILYMPQHAHLLLFDPSIKKTAFQEVLILDTERNRDMA